VRAPVYSIVLKFYELIIEFQTDSQAVAGRLECIYQRFLAVEESLTTQIQSKLVLLISRNDRNEKPGLIIDGIGHEVEGIQHREAWAEVCAYETVLRTILQKVRSHYLFHAGVVSDQGKAVVIAADALHGKSTLTLELVRRGFKFLSDEFAAISRSDGQVYPFPRALRLCPDTLSRLGFEKAALTAPIWLDKTLLDIEEIIPGSLGKTSELKHVIVLRDPSGRSDATAQANGRWLGILIDRGNEDFIAELDEIQALYSYHGDISKKYTFLELTVRSKQAALPEIQAACERHGITLYQVYTRKDERPSFDGPARLTPLPHSQMTLELIKRLMGGRQSDLVQDALGGSPKRLFAEVAALLKSVKCWELTVGPLDQMADLICSLEMGG
jgi:hypothetical protein